MNAVNCALIGSGNIGTDLLAKLKRSETLNPVWMVGIEQASEGLRRAREAGLENNTTLEALGAVLDELQADDVKIAFDVTSTYVHAENNRALSKIGVVVVDPTPAAIGPFCVASVNIAEHIGSREPNVNMVTCRGQATIPLVHAVSRVQSVDPGAQGPTGVAHHAIQAGCQPQTEDDG